MRHRASRKLAKIATIRRHGVLRSFVSNTSGIRHTVELEAGTLFEAAALALRAFRQHGCDPGVMGKVEVEIRSSVTHTLTVQRLQTWLNGGAKNPKEAVMKERLRELL